jgi:hypothetical protein
MKKRQLCLEKLESKDLMAHDLSFDYELEALPLPTNVNHISTVSNLANASTTVPLLSSNPTATKKLFLDFDGNSLATWAFFNNINTPAYDFDGNTAVFSDDELNAINEIWRRVSEDYSIFNVDVTTVDPGSVVDNVNAVVVIGGSYTDWYGSAAGGVAFVGGFSNFSSNYGFVFSNSLGNSPKNVAEASAHEGGHLFGLSHQGLWDGTTLITNYNTGFGDFAPIMGNSYSAALSTWYNGTSGPGVLQDDTAKLSLVIPFKADDYTNSIVDATELVGTFNINGLINDNTTHIVDSDIFKITSTGGNVTLSANPAAGVGNTNLELKILDSNGGVIHHLSPTNSYGAAFNDILPPGTYYVAVTTNGTYGQYGQYTLEGSIEQTTVSTRLVVDGQEVQVNDIINFGNLSIDEEVYKTLTITNLGTDELEIFVDTTAQFTVFGDVFGIMAPGESFTVQISPDTSSSALLSGSLIINGENVLNLTGVVQTPPAVNLSTTNIDFGNVTLNSNIANSVAVFNVGEQDLVISSVTIQGNFSTTNTFPVTLVGGQNISISVVPNTAFLGTLNGSLTINTNVGSYVVSLTANIVSNEITVLVDGNNVNSGDTANFGDVAVNGISTKTFTIRNDGNVNLDVTSIVVPTGFSIVQNITKNTLVPGEITTFIVGLNTSTQGNFSGKVIISNSDNNEGQFEINVSGNVVGPEITITQNSVNINSGDLVDFGSVTKGTNVTKVFTIRNDGLTQLNLNGISMPAGFQLKNAPRGKIQPGQSFSFTVKLDTSKIKNYSGQITIRSNDLDESQFIIQVSANVVAPQQSPLAKLRGQILRFRR